MYYCPKDKKDIAFCFKTSKKRKTLYDYCDYYNEHTNECEFFR